MHRLIRPVQARPRAATGHKGLQKLALRNAGKSGGPKNISAHFAQEKGARVCPTLIQASDRLSLLFSAFLSPKLESAFVRQALAQNEAWVNHHRACLDRSLLDHEIFQMS
jgi:hypothetical protein